MNLVLTLFIRIIKLAQNTRGFFCPCQGFQRDGMEWRNHVEYTYMRVIVEV